MKKRNCLFTYFCACVSALVLLMSVFPRTAFAEEEYTSTTMRLLHYEGTVGIEDASGKQLPVMENARLRSGETMKTGEASSAFVGLDKGRVCTLDALSRVEFTKGNGALTMNLTEGRIFLDVSDKLDAGETMDVRTSTIAVGIRGTILFISSEPVADESAGNLESVDLTELAPEKGSIIRLSQVGVLEGSTEITYLDDAGQQQTLAVDAGQKAIVSEYSEDAEGTHEPVVSEITQEELKGFVLDRVTEDASILNRVKQACDVADDIIPSGRPGQYTADGDWTWDGTVTLVAQSASKYYDGQPLTRTSDILVDGLPSGFSVKASAGGSRTEAGESDNPVSNYAIYNEAGEDVTKHFTDIETVSGKLLVVPAPLTIHTGTAEKVYDGTSLTDPEGYVTFYKGTDNRQIPWRNTSYVVTERAGGVSDSSLSDNSQILYGICGVIWVNAANPLTGERREIQLRAGQKLIVFLSDQEGEQSIELKIENVSENDLPDKLLRLYADNEAMLQQACRDTGWDIEIIRGRIEALPESASGDGRIEQGGLLIPESDSDCLMQDLTNVSITIDTEITDYNDRALGTEEAHYASLAVDESIKVTPVGRQTDAGTSLNEYTIDWGSADRSNYEVSEDLGTLTVLPASATVTTGSAKKEYDGTPLTNSEASISGLVNGETATVTATGSITQVGSAVNTYSIRWGSADSGNYSISEDLGTLRVTERSKVDEVTLTAASAEKTYDGTPLTDSAFTVEGLPSGYTVTADVSGSRTDAGVSDNTITSFKIWNADGNDVTAQFPEITTMKGTLKVNPASATVTTGSAEKMYDGTPLTGAEASVSGIVSADEGDVTVTATGTITDIGTADNTYSIDWGGAKSSNYTLSESLGTLEVTPNDTEITFTSASAEKVYDGTALSAPAVTVEGLPEGLSYKCTAGGAVSIVDAGTCSNQFDDIEYTSSDDDGNPIVGWRNAVIYDADGNDVTDRFTNLQFVTGTLTITPAELVVTTGSAEKTYDGTALTSSEASVSGLAGADKGDVTVTATGTITDVGTADNTYSIDWGGANSSNYTVLEEVGILTVEKLPIEFNLYFPKEMIDGVETDPTFVYDGYARSPEWITAYYEGMDEGLDPDDWDLDPEGQNYSFIFSLPGGGKVRLTGSGYSDAGTHTFEPADTFLEGSGDNYEFTFSDNLIVIEPVEIVLISDDAYAVTSDVYISEYGLKVQVNNVGAEVYEVVSTGENEWRISFDWGDKIDVGKIVIKDGNSFVITPIHQFISGDPGNYSIDTVDQEGTMVDPAYSVPDGLFGSVLMKRSSAPITPNPADDTGTSDADFEEDPEEELEEDSEEEIGEDSEEDKGEESEEESGTDAGAEATGHIGTAADDEGTAADSADSESVQKEEAPVDSESAQKEETPAASESAQQEEAPTEEEEPQEEPRKEEPKAEVPQKEEQQAEEPEAE